MILVSLWGHTGSEPKRTSGHPVPLEREHLERNALKKNIGEGLGVRSSGTPTCCDQPLCSDVRGGHGHRSVQLRQPQD